MRSRRVIRTIQQGEIFGEVALIFSSVRTATIVSENYTTLAFLMEKNFLELWDYSPDTFHMIKNHAIAYKDDPWINFKVKLLKQIDYFKKSIN